MFRNIFSHIQGIEFFPILTLIFFFTFFVAVAYMAIRLDKRFAAYMGNLPLEHDDNDMNKNNGE
ncbi:hypothetical protein MASR1M45_08880 [Candidatus Kapaibacterium sp.]